MTTIYEECTYSVTVGPVTEATRLRSKQGWQALEAGGFATDLVGYLIIDTGGLHRIIPRVAFFDGDDDRREFWKRLFENAESMAFATPLRPLVMDRNVQLLPAAP